MRHLIVAFALACGNVNASAQSVDCNNAMTQSDMNFCAGQAWEAADDDLNLAYRLAMDSAKSMDEYLQAGDEAAATALRDAQRLWIPFRDQACFLESLTVRGGSMQPLITYSCLERLTRQRTEDLRIFGETN